MDPQQLKTAVAILFCGLATVAASTGPPARSQSSATGRDYERSVADWRAKREADLKADDGWLTLVGLHWLRDGVNRIGSDPDAEVPLPEGSAPRLVGTIAFGGGVARFTPSPNARVAVNGRPAETQVLRPQPGDYDVVTTGAVTFFVIRRGDRYGVRVRDRNSAARREFKALHWYPVREEYRVTGRYVPHPKPTSLMIANVLGAIEPWATPGTVTFAVGGREYTLHPVLDGPDASELFFIFRDLTTGRETYPGGRFLYAEMPKDGRVVLDFNKAHSPPCAFTPFATCPVPPKQNHLGVRIEAGELNPHL